MTHFLRLTILASLITIFIFNAPTAQAQDDKRIFVDQEVITLTNAEGFTDVKGLSEELDQLVTQFVPEANELLAFMFSNEDIARLGREEEPTMSRYIMIQKARGSVTVTDSEFDAIKTEIKKALEDYSGSTQSEVDRLVNKANKNISEDFDVALELEIGDSKHLGYLRNEKEILSSLSLISVSSNVEGAQESKIMAGTDSYINIKNRVLFVYMYTHYSEAQDLEWLKSATISYTDKLFAKNPATPPVTTQISAQSANGAVASIAEPKAKTSMLRNIVLLIIIGLSLLMIRIIWREFTASKRNEEF